MTKKQHWVPRGYLSKFGWCTSKSGKKYSVYYYNKSSETVNSADTMDFCQDQYFYEMNGLKFNYLEELFSLIEDKFHTVHTKIIQSGNISSVTILEMDIICKYVYYLLIRTKPFMDSLDRRLNLLRNSFNLPTSEIGSIGSPAFHLLEISSRSAEWAALELTKRRLILLKTTENFITSDHPVVRINSVGIYNWSTGSLTEPTTEIYLPLSPKFCLGLIPTEVILVAKKALTLFRQDYNMRHPLDEVEFKYNQLEIKIRFITAIYLSRYESEYVTIDDRHMSEIIKSHYMTNHSCNIICSSIEQAYSAKNSHQSEDRRRIGNYIANQEDDIAISRFLESFQEISHSYYKAEIRINSLQKYSMKFNLLSGIFLGAIYLIMRRATYLK